jgi:hypothetical protein
MLDSNSSGKKPCTQWTGIHESCINKMRPTFNKTAEEGLSWNYLVYEFSHGHLNDSYTTVYLEHPHPPPRHWHLNSIDMIKEKIKGILLKTWCMSKVITMCHQRTTSALFTVDHTHLDIHQKNVFRQNPHCVHILYLVSILDQSWIHVNSTPFNVGSMWR